jgi:molybdopterin-guanine dinucleotide biosynthesis protein MobB
MKVVGFAGFSGSGKTTLVEQLIPALRLRGLRVSVVKHAHHSFDIDTAGEGHLPAPRGPAPSRWSLHRAGGWP